MGAGLTVFDTVLVANRGEIAVRVIDTLAGMGIRSVAVHSDVDADALHVATADVAVRVGPAPAAESYLAIERVVQAALRTGAQAVHPGYGFLSENAAFARACADAGLVFIGPPPAAIEAMGDKIAAKQTAVRAGAPIVPGVFRPGMSDADLIAAAADVGFPLMVKASAGGGGKGMRVVHDPSDLAAAITAARREARGAFGDDALMLERFVQRPRHIEVQVLADAHGTTLAVGERECSLQRRHQKVVEECPSPAIDPPTRQAMGAAAVAIAEQVGYVGAGTVEFITDADARDFFFLEMNTRLQVEHPVTELVHGLDLVEQQIRIAAGEPLGVDAQDLEPVGHAVEARVYAEDPAAGFLPTGGTVLGWHRPVLDARIDEGIRPGSVVTSHYDPMLAKVVAAGATREEALRHLEGHLAATALFGFPTNVGFLRRLVAHPEVRAGRLHTGLIEAHLDELADAPVPEAALAAVALATLARRRPDLTGPVDPFDVPSAWRPGGSAWTTWRLRVAAGDPVDVRVRPGPDGGAEVVVGEGDPVAATVTLEGDRLDVVIDGRHHRFLADVTDDRAWIATGGDTWLVREEDPLAAHRHDRDATSGLLVAPMPGAVAAVEAEVGQPVTRGQTLVVVEAMKMEHPLTAPFDGTVGAVHVTAGQQVAMEAPLLRVDPAEDEEEA